MPSSAFLPVSHESTSLKAAKEAAAKAEDRLREAIDVLPQGVVFLDDEGRYILWNQQYAAIYERSADLLAPGALLAETLRIGVQRGDYPEAEGREEEWLSQRLALLDNPGTRHEQRLANGRWIMIEERKTQSGGTIGLRVDITDLKEREQSFRLLFEGNPVPLLVYEATGETILAANDAACSHFGYAKHDLEGIDASKLFDPEEWDDARDLLATTSSDKSRFWRQTKSDNSRLESVLFTSQSLHSGAQASIISVFDITERRRIEARMDYMARHDQLTGLANRTQCREQLHKLLAPDAPAKSVTVALIDLDHFKSINDTYGHLIGDALLAEAGKRMLAQISSKTLLCRIGGDEFAIIFPKASREQVELVAKSITVALSKPFYIGGHTLRIGATVGSASAPQDSNDPEMLLRFADLALYSSKAAKRGSYQAFKASMHDEAQKKSKLENDLREAVVKGDLEVHYQPLVNLENGELQGYEALLRWTHPDWGSIPPAVFIPLAEELALIDQIGQFVLRAACKAAAQWDEHTTIAVNVSPLQFRNGHLLNSVLQALSYSGLAPERLELEITEAVLMVHGPETRATIRSLRALGVGLSMDDFGTGYSSLSYLLSYPFTKIKIDKSFVLNLEEDSNSQAIIRAVLGLGKSLGLTVTAEGIECEATRDYLQSAGCTQGQGYLFGKAVPEDEIMEPLPLRITG